jgi:hypothetical protein
MNVHNEDRLARVPRLGKGIQIGQVEARVPARESDIGTGVMVGNRQPSLIVCFQATVLAERVETEATRDHVLLLVCVVLANALALCGCPKAVKSGVPSEPSVNRT